jgi:hypothetical protein
MNKAREIGAAAAALEAGERLAARIAARQAAVAAGPSARFFALQARQETFHARAFATAVALVAPGPAAANPAAAALAALGARLDRDLDARDVARSVVGLQVAFEALGVAVLGGLEALVAAHVPALALLHRRLALQEAAHHAFGVRYVERARARGELSAAGRAAAAGEYGALAQGVLRACDDVIDGLGAPAGHYPDAFRAALPAWFRATGDA